MKEDGRNMEKIVPSGEKKEKITRPFPLCDILSVYFERNFSDIPVSDEDPEGNTKDKYAIEAEGMIYFRKAMEFMRGDIYGARELHKGRPRNVYQRAVFEGMARDSESFSEEIEKQFPWLREITYSEEDLKDRKSKREWYQKLVEKYGGSHMVTRHG